MPNSLASLTDSIETNSITHTIGNLARAATTRHRHSQHLSSTTALPVPQPPQHTNVSSHAHDHTATANARRLSADYSSSAPNSFSHSPSNSSSQLDNRRNSAVGLSAIDGPINNMTIEFDGGTHVIVRPNRIIRGKVVLTAVERLYVTRIRVKVRHDTTLVLTCWTHIWHKFRAEEVAIVRIDEGGGENKGGERLHETITTFFEADWKLWGNDATGNRLMMSMF